MLHARSESRASRPPASSGGEAEPDPAGACRGGDTRISNYSTLAQRVLPENEPAEPVVPVGQALRRPERMAMTALPADNNSLAFTVPRQGRHVNGHAESGLELSCATRQPARIDSLGAERGRTRRAAASYFVGDFHRNRIAMTEIPGVTGDQRQAFLKGYRCLGGIGQFQAPFAAQRGCPVGDLNGHGQGNEQVQKFPGEVFRVGAEAASLSTHAPTARESRAPGCLADPYTARDSHPSTRPSTSKPPNATLTSCQNSVGFFSRRGADSPRRTSSGLGRARSVTSSDSAS